MVELVCLDLSRTDCPLPRQGPPCRRRKEWTLGPDLTPFSEAKGELSRTDWSKREAEAQASRRRRLWAAMELSLELPTCESIVSGRPVRAGNLDGFVLRRALRGAPLPKSETYLAISDEMLDAVVEAGAIR